VPASSPRRARASVEEGRVEACVDSDVRAVGVFVRSDARQLSQLTALIDSGELRVDIAQRVPLADLPAVHAKGDAGEVSGKVVVVEEQPETRSHHHAPHP